MIYLLGSSSLALLGLSGLTHDLYCIRKNRSTPAFTKKANDFYPFGQHAVTLYKLNKSTEIFGLFEWNYFYLILFIYNVILFIT